MPIRRLEKSYTGTTSTIGGDELAANTIPVKSHIQYGVLQPAVAGKLLNGATHSGAYGTAQTQSGGDGHKYYYTDIKGSKPIKDPRIGAHFGSQRHKCTSLQLLEQETATHGQNVYSVDGREWFRVTGPNPTTNHTQLAGAYNSIQFNPSTANDWIEVVGYFNDVNVNVAVLSNSANDVNIYIDGTDTGNNYSTRGTNNSPLFISRYVESGSLVNINVGSLTTPGIHTLKIGATTTYHYIHSIELIAQDTTSTANKSKIQIPAQNVVSYGKKFSIPATAQHYNPFATKGDGSASTIPNNTTGDSVATGWAGSTSAYWDSTLDTATSLGLSAWESGGNYFRPVNGGRVVKWVDSSGTIKTSVNMMPPEAHASESTSTISSGAASGSVAPTGTHNWSTQNLPQFGNKTVGSNLWTEMTDNSSYVFDTRPSGGLNGAWANPSGYGLAYVSVTLTTGKLYRLRFDASSVSGVASYIGTGSDSAASNWKNKSLITNGTNLTSVFRATATTPMIVMHTASGASAFTLANMTLFELEEPDSQAEVAKSFHFREFGNGAANGGTGGTYADASMLNSNDNISYVMDDGLTSISATGATSGGTTGLSAAASSMKMYLTFIGTGFSMHHQATGTWNKIAQNLPYGTHIIEAGWTDQGKKVKVDSVEVLTGNDQAIENDEFTIYQPKMPPVPDDACILADYMLMADFVPSHTAGHEKISKGSRLISASRDFFHDTANGTLAFEHGRQASAKGGLIVQYVNPGVNEVGPQLTWFGDAKMVNEAVQISDSTERSKHYFDGSTTDVTVTSDYTDSGAITTGLPSSSEAHYCVYGTKTSGVMGKQISKFVAHPDDTSNDWLYYSSAQVATPIHTSSHYQSFETPYLHELVGGDRNMEQTNLVVTSDGKSWDEVTRDTSYIGVHTGFYCGETPAVSANEELFIHFDAYRGGFGDSDSNQALQKNFAIGYNRIYCLVDGWYTASWGARFTSGLEAQGYFKVNNAIIANSVAANSNNGDRSGAFKTVQIPLKRGDYLQIVFTQPLMNESGKYNSFQITKID